MGFGSGDRGCDRSRGSEWEHGLHWRGVRRSLEVDECRLQAVLVAQFVTWTALTDNQATLAVGAIAIQPGNGSNSVILVGTGESNSSADSYYGLGILRSANAGGTWALISSDTTGTRSFAGMGFSKIAFSSNTPSIVVAATAGASEGIIEGLENPLTANLGLYYSGDGGNTWRYGNVSDGGVTTAPGSVSSVVYNAVSNSGLGQFFAALRYHGFYSSDSMAARRGLVAQSTRRRFERDRMSTESQFVDLSDLPRRDCGGSRAAMRCMSGTWMQTISIRASGNPRMAATLGLRSTTRALSIAATNSVAEPSRAATIWNWRRCLIGGSDRPVRRDHQPL